MIERLTDKNKEEIEHVIDLLNTTVSFGLTDKSLVKKCKKIILGKNKKRP